MKFDLIWLYKTWKTVFSSADLAAFFESEYMIIRKQISYQVKKWNLFRIKAWIFALDKNYNPLELATKILKPSYISLETVLRREGIIFQYSQEINIISYKTINMNIDWHEIQSRFMKENIRENFSWIEYKDNISIASKERAFLDMIYLEKDIYFDNLRPIDWKKCFELVKIYDSKITEKRLNSYYNDYVKHFKT